MIYFKNKNDNTTIQVGDDTPRFLEDCRKNPELVEITEQEYLDNQIKEEIEYKPSYNELVDSKIRERYSLSEELAILRQRDVKVEEFTEYNDFCENCKHQARLELGI